MPLPAVYDSDQILVTTDKSSASIKLLGYYGYSDGAENVGNVGTANPLFVGPAYDPMFSAPRLDVTFFNIEGDVSAAVSLAYLPIVDELVNLLD